MTSQIHPGHAAREPFAHSDAGRLAGRAVVAGIIGGILIDVFLFFTGAPFPGVYQFIASTVVGKEALASPSYIWLGVAMHFAVSIAWALIYALVASRLHVLHRYLVAGLVFGVVVMVVMEIVQMVAGIAQPITTKSAIITIISHIVFFGLPVAWFVGRSVRPSVIATLGLNTPKGE